MREDTSYLPPAPDEPAHDPHNLEMEQALLGAILVNNEALALVDFLMPDHFFEPLHGRIYAACITLNAAGSVASPVTVKDYFVGDEALKAVGGVQYLARLTVAAVTVLHSADYGRAIYDLWVRRRILETGRMAAELVGRGKAEETGESILHKIEDELGTIRGAPLTQKTTWKFGDALVKLVNYCAGGDDEEQAHRIVPSGWQTLDDKLAWFKGDMNIVGARTGMGKSTFSCQLAMNLARAGYTVGFFSPDMTHDQMAARMITSYIAEQFQQMVVYEKLLKRKIDGLDAKYLAEATQAVYDYPIMLDDKGKPTVGHIVSRARDWQRRFRAQGRTLDVLLVDHIHKLSATKATRGRGRPGEVAEISGDLVAAARDLDVAMIAFAQLTDHDKASKEIMPPRLGDLRYADELEHDARSVLFLHRPWYFREKQMPERRNFKSDNLYEVEMREWEADKVAQTNLLELHIAKQNNGPKGIVKMYVHLPTSYIGEGALFR